MKPRAGERQNGRRIDRWILSLVPKQRERASEGHAGSIYGQAKRQPNTRRNWRTTDQSAPHREAPTAGLGPFPELPMGLDGKILPS